MGKAERDKGKREEQWCSRFHRERGLNAERQIQQKRTQDCADVHLLVADARIMLECKNLKRVQLADICNAIAQCHGYRQAANDVPAAWIHVPRTSQRLVCFYAEDFVRLLELLRPADGVAAAANGPGGYGQKVEAV